MMVSEIKSVADAKQILLPADTTKNNLDKMRSLPPESTTSMHSDFRKGGRTELESLTGYVIREAAAMHLSVPTYSLMYEKLRK
jgi:2-dehydropantoate 2-reductase